MSVNRRAFLSGIIASFTAPAIIRPGLLMPMKPSLLKPSAIMGNFDPVLISMIRRVEPNLIAHELIKIQPMTEPIEAIFKYDWSIVSQLERK